MLHTRKLNDTPTELDTQRILLAVSAVLSIFFVIYYSLEHLLSYQDNAGFDDLEQSQLLLTEQNIRVYQTMLGPAGTAINASGWIVTSGESEGGKSNESSESSESSEGSDSYHFGS